MLHTCACVHVVYVCLCSCSVRTLVFMSRTYACVYVTCTCACFHVAYACLISCHVGVPVFMSCTCACVHVAYVHVAYVGLCSCCARVILFGLYSHFARVANTCACIRVTYTRACVRAACTCPSVASRSGAKGGGTPGPQPFFLCLGPPPFLRIIHFICTR